MRAVQLSVAGVNKGEDRPMTDTRAAALEEALKGTLGLIRKAQERLCTYLHPDADGGGDRASNPMTAITPFRRPQSLIDQRVQYLRSHQPYEPPACDHWRPDERSWATVAILFAAPFAGAAVAVLFHAVAG